MKYCYSCFKVIEDHVSVCPHCRKNVLIRPKEPNYLMPGTILGNRYVIGDSIKAGGFGIIYKAYDTKLDVLVAIKEFYPCQFVSRAAGEKNVIVTGKYKDAFDYRKRRFLAEARTMASFGSHRNIAKVFEYFEENNVAYIVMELLQGMDLSDYLKQNGRLDADFAIFIINEVSTVLRIMHERGIIHRDIAPDNIFLCEGADLKVKLLDLGSAILPDCEEDAVDMVLKVGYSPVEQYSDTGIVGTWSDVYALGATLYAMLTGIRPDEATNREKGDAVVPPSSIDESIDENLSNSVMRAMAVYYHMRFKNVDEFVKAINGEKKVISLKAEKRRRNLVRILEIAVVVVAVSVLGLFVYKRYDDKKSAQILKAAEIDVWFAVADGSNEEVAMQTIFNDFSTKFPNVTINYRAIPENEYNAVLEEAVANGTLPDLYESTNVPVGVLNSARDCSLILKSDQAKECKFLDGYSDPKRIPLGISVPVAYVVTNGPVAIECNTDTFNGLSDFGNVDIAIDKEYQALVELNFGTYSWSSPSSFMSNNNSVAVMMSSTMNIDKVKSTLTAVQKKCLVPNGSVVCDYVYFYSLGPGSKSEEAAANRLLEWMLGNYYQNTLMISRCNDGQLPLNDTAFKEKVSNNELSCLLDVSKSFSFRIPSAELTEWNGVYYLTIICNGPDGAPIRTIEDEYFDGEEYSIDPPIIENMSPINTTGISGKMTENMTIAFDYVDIPITGAKSLVYKSYLLVLGRYPTNQEVEDLKNSFEANSIDAEGIATFVLLGNEAIEIQVSDENFVKYSYVLFFGRQPSDEELNFWSNQITSGSSTKEDFISQLVASGVWQTINQDYLIW